MPKNFFVRLRIFLWLEKSRFGMQSVRFHFAFSLDAGVFFSNPILVFLWIILPCLFQQYTKTLWCRSFVSWFQCHWAGDASSRSLCVIFMILVSLENVKKCALGGCLITSKTKINVFWNFFSLHWPLRIRSVRKFFKTCWGK